MQKQHVWVKKTVPNAEPTLRVDFLTVLHWIMIIIILFIHYFEDREHLVLLTLYVSA